MSVDPTSTLARPQPTSTSSLKNDAGGMDRDAFMKLLVHQLKNQDPTEPMDAREMVTQLSQLTGIEKLEAIDKRMGALEVATVGMVNTQTSSLAGKSVIADGSRLRLTETGSVRASYALEAPAKEVTINIRDASGRTVRTMKLGAQALGPQRIEWDGKDDTGTRLDPGKYTLEISARGDNGVVVNANTRISGRVEKVSYEHGYPELMVGDARILLGDVVSIAE